MRIVLPANFSEALDTSDGLNLFRRNLRVEEATTRQISETEWEVTLNISNSDSVDRAVLLFTGEEHIGDNPEYPPGISLDSTTLLQADGSEVLALGPGFSWGSLLDEPLADFAGRILSRYDDGNSFNPTITLDQDDLFQAGNRNDILHLAEGDDRAMGRRGRDQIEGGEGDDTLSGGAGNDQLSGGLGQDNLFGNGGRDRLDGMEGNDALNGGGGRDHLSGGEGADLLNGGKGRDTLTGDDGGDGFQFFKGSGRDTITDFENDVDTLMLDTRLWRGEMSAEEVIENFATFQNGGTLLDFGRHELFIEGIFNASSLADDIQLM